MRIVVALLLAMCSITTAKAAMFVGYDQFCGVPVVLEKTSQVAVAARDANGAPIIYVDPDAMSNWTHSRIFVLAHECGHHRLGHSMPSGMWFRQRTSWATRVQELQADCWAAIALKQIWAIADIDRVIAIHMKEGNVSVGGYPSGVERAENIKNCAYGGYSSEAQNIPISDSSVKPHSADQIETPHSFRTPDWMLDSKTSPEAAKPRESAVKSNFGRYLEITKTLIPKLFVINGTTRKYEEKGVCRLYFEFTFADNKTHAADLDLRENINFPAGEINDRWVWVDIATWDEKTSDWAPHPNSKLYSLNEDGPGSRTALLSFGMAQYGKQETADSVRDTLMELVNICHSNSI